MTSTTQKKKVQGAEKEKNERAEVLKKKPTSSQ